MAKLKKGINQDPFHVINKKSVSHFYSLRGLLQQVNSKAFPIAAKLTQLMYDDFISQYLWSHEQLEAVTTCPHRIFNVYSTMTKKKKSPKITIISK